MFGLMLISVTTSFLPGPDLLAVLGFGAAHDRNAGLSHDIGVQENSTAELHFNSRLTGNGAALVPVKLIDHDGDGVPDEDRVPSNYSGVAIVVGKGMGQSTGFRVGKRHAVIVAHAGDNDEDGTVHLAPGRERLLFQGCRTEAYRSVQKVCGTDNTFRDWHRDFCVVEVDRDICAAAEIFAIGYPEDRKSILNLDLKATGFYPEDVIGAKAIEAQTGNRFWNSEEKPKSDLPNKTSSLKQFTSSGRIFGFEMIDQARIDYYQMGQNYGGSGGPIFYEGPEGEKIVVGIQFSHTFNAQANYNYSIAIVGSVLDFFVMHVPDVQVRSVFSN